MKRKVLIAILTAGCVTLASAGAYADNPKGYKTEAGAQKHCPGDEVVWGNVNSKSGAYHFKGTKSYGNTKDGAYACRGELEKAGWHAAKNNQ